MISMLETTIMIFMLETTIALILLNVGELIMHIAYNCNNISYVLVHCVHLYYKDR